LFDRALGLEPQRRREQSDPAGVVHAIAGYRGDASFRRIGRAPLFNIGDFEP
jgi:hypothetical protein